MARADLAARGICVTGKVVGHAAKNHEGQLNGSIIFILHKVFDQTTHRPLLFFLMQIQTPQGPLALVVPARSERGADR